MGLEHFANAGTLGKNEKYTQRPKSPLTFLPFKKPGLIAIDGTTYLMFLKSGCISDIGVLKTYVYAIGL